MANRDQVEVTSCVFCAWPPTKFWLTNEHALAFWDDFPLVAGHAVVVPRRHVISVFELPDTESAALWRLVAQVRQHLLGTRAPDGFTVCVNDGAAAGQTVFHGHVHVVPRREGDVTGQWRGIRRIFHPWF